MELLISSKSICTLCGDEELLNGETTDSLCTPILQKLMKINYHQCVKCTNVYRQPNTVKIMCVECRYEYDYPETHIFLACDQLPICEECRNPLLHQCKPIKSANSRK